MAGKKPDSIKLPSSAGSAGAASSAEGKTPTQETSRMSLNEGSEPLSKRRGSESLSIGIPAGAAAAIKGRGTGGSGSSSLSVTPMDEKASNGLKKNGTLKTSGSSATSAARPHVQRHNATGGSPQTSAVVSDEDEGDETGYEGEKEPDSARSSGAATRKQSKGNHPARNDAASTSSTSSNSTLTDGHAGLHNMAEKQHKQANGVHQQAQSKANKGPTQHSFDIHGTQPVRNHHHRASTTSSINSTRRDKDIPCFPTPGAKEENRNPFEEEKSFEEIRLLEAQAKTRHWKRWGPYLSERQWVSANTGKGSRQAVLPYSPLLSGADFACLSANPSTSHAIFLRSLGMSSLPPS